MPRQDPDSGGVLGIETSHYKIHEGRSFHTSAVDTSMGAGDTLSLAFKTPANPEFHVVAGFRSKASAHFECIEEATWVGNTGTVNPVYNRNRNSSIITTALEDSTGTFVGSSNVTLNPSSVANGDSICTVYTWTDKKTTTVERDQAEFELKASTQYAFRITTDEATDAAQVVLNWYELTDIK